MIPLPTEADVVFRKIRDDADRCFTESSDPRGVKYRIDALEKHVLSLATCVAGMLDELDDLRKDKAVTSGERPG